MPEQTITIQIKDSKALKLIKDLQALDLITIIEENTDAKASNLSKRMIGSLSEEDAKKLDQELEQLKEEWNRDI